MNDTIEALFDEELIETMDVGKIGDDQAVGGARGGGW